MIKQEKQGTSVYLYYFFKSINNHILCTKKLLDKILRKVISWPINLSCISLVYGGKHVTCKMKFLYLNLNLIILTIESKKQ